MNRYFLVTLSCVPRNDVEEADKICRWLDEVQDQLETKISEAEE